VPKTLRNEEFIKNALLIESEEISFLQTVYNELQK
jgi:hypothetical protein